MSSAIYPIYLTRLSLCYVFSLVVVNCDSEPDCRDLVLIELVYIPRVADRGRLQVGPMS